MGSNGEGGARKEVNEECFGLLPVQVPVLEPVPSRLQMESRSRTRTVAGCPTSSAFVNASHRHALPACVQTDLDPTVCRATAHHLQTIYSTDTEPSSAASTVQRPTQRTGNTGTRCYCSNREYSLVVSVPLTPPMDRIG